MCSMDADLVLMLQVTSGSTCVFLIPRPVSSGSLVPERGIGSSLANDIARLSLSFRVL